MDIFHSTASFALLADEIEYRFYQARTYGGPSCGFYEKVHSHNAWEIYVHDGGKVSYSIDGELLPLERGDVVICRPGELHNCVYSSDTVHEYRCLWISVDPLTEQGRLISSSVAKRKYSPEPAVSRQIDAAYAALYESPINEQRRLILRLIALIQGSEAAKSTPLHGPSRQLKNVIAYIDENYSAIGSMAEVAEKNYISLPTLNRTFKKYMGITPNDYLNLKRITKARALLDEGLSVTDTSVQLGYSSCSYFIRLFKEQYGMTPYKYKNRLS